MLTHLTVQNFIIVTDLDIQFKNGLTTITGESGTGKSILLGALNLILGQRASAESVRPGSTQANICAEFSVDDCFGARKLLKDAQVANCEDGVCIIRRTISADGGSRAFINGTPVTLRFLQEISRELIEICDQNAHQHLTEPSSQIQFLDNYGKHADQAGLVRNLYREWQSCEQQIIKLESNSEAQTDRRELLSYQLGELKALELLENEFDQIENNHRRLSTAKDLTDTTQLILEVIDDLDPLRQGDSRLSSIEDSDSNLESAKDNLRSALTLIDDSQRDLKRYQSQIIIDPESLNQLETRLNRIIEIAKKHRVAPNDVPAQTKYLEEQLNKLEKKVSGIDILRVDSGKLKEDFLREGEKLSLARKGISQKFQTEVENHMSLLGIAKGRLKIIFSEGLSADGIEHIEFLIQTNPKFEPAPLKKIASGGEQTRIFLSIQIVAAKTTRLPTLILDEADVGVGGTTADTIGRLLYQLGSSTQVICVTHAPQVAAIGQNHYRVVKNNDETTIEPLNEEMRVEELARMLAGSGISKKTRDYANTLLKEARNH